jgi:hypothetical protein
MLSGYLAKPQSMVIGLSWFRRLIATVFIVSSGHTFPSQAATPPTTTSVIAILPSNNNIIVDTELQFSGLTNPEHHKPLLVAAWHHFCSVEFVKYIGSDCQ